MTVSTYITAIKPHPKLQQLVCRNPDLRVIASLLYQATITGAVRQVPEDLWEYLIENDNFDINAPLPCINGCARCDVCRRSESWENGVNHIIMSICGQSLPVNRDPAMRELMVKSDVDFLDPNTLIFVGYDVDYCNNIEDNPRSPYPTL